MPQTRRALPRLIAASLALCALPTAAQQTAADKAKPAQRTAPLPIPALGEETVIVADRVSGLNDAEAVAEGQVELTKGDAKLNADKLTYRKANDEVEAQGNVRLERGEDRMSGPHLRIQLKAETGEFREPEYQIKRSIIRDEAKRAVRTDKIRNAGRGKADLLLEVDSEDANLTRPLPTGRGNAALIEFEGKGHYRLHDATYSTCTPGDDGTLDWFAKVSDLRLDYDDEVAIGHNGALYFKDVPILYSPWLSFPLNNRRKTGLLTPTLGSSSNTGFEFTQPFYWNIAPNLDATLSPRLMSKRGAQLNTEVRYLEPKLHGELRSEYLPHDSETKDHRYAFSWRHQQNFGGGLAGRVNFAKVSDDNYFSDLSTRLTTVAQTHLLRQAELEYRTDAWNVNVAAQVYQTLQDPRLPEIGEPYKRLPQIRGATAPIELPFGLVGDIEAEAVRFQHAVRAEGLRASIYPSVRWEWQTPGISFTPKFGVRSLYYDVSRYIAFDPNDLNKPVFGPRPSPVPANYSADLSVPVTSLDLAAQFEREIDFFGVRHIQTLEPRLFYVYAPARYQAKIPVFDSAVADLSFVQIFSENRYVGGDRIGDANQLTGMVSSRLVDPVSGAELLRAGIGQRVYFSEQKVGLPGETLRTSNKSDLLATFSGRILPTVWADAGWQYDIDAARTNRLNFGLRYQPERGQVINAAYRYARPVTGAPLSGVEQYDLSAQWPLGGAWHGVARYNYSLKDKRLVEALGGVEYNSGCWALRTVIQRTATQFRDSNTALFFQLELKDFSRIGSNPLDLLRRSVPGYDTIIPTAEPGIGDSIE